MLVRYVGHATVLLELSGVRLLTDPMLRARVGHLRRIVAAPDPDSLDVDAVLVSHAHHDHLDVPSLRLVNGRPRVLCASPAARSVRRAGLVPDALEPGDAASVGAVSVEATEADHDGRRWPLISRDPTSVGFLLTGADDGARVYFAGDTGPFDGIERIGPVDVALLPVAGWGPKLGPGHLDPESAAEMAVRLRARVAIPIHWGTYRRLLMAADGSADRPAREFAEHVARLDPTIRVEVLAPGGEMSFSF